MNNAIGTIEETTPDQYGRERALVTLAINAAGQPVTPRFQYEARTGRFICYRSRFVVVSDLGNTMHGEWTEQHNAERFARSLPGVVKEVEPYWYAPGFGRASAALADV
jgi:hypothetical protein